MDPTQFVEEQFDDNIDEEIENQIENLEELRQEAENLKKVDVRYARPKIDQQNDFSQDKDVLLMQIDCDYYSRDQCIDNKNHLVPIIRMFCLNEKGNSILLHISGVEPYFYIEAPDNLQLNKNGLEQLKLELNRRAMSIRTLKSFDAVRKIEVCQKESIKEFKGINYTKPNFLKIYTYFPTYVASLRTIFEQGFNYQGINFFTKTYESNMPFALRFMIDKDIVGMGWVKVKAGQFGIRPSNQCVSRCQLEINVSESGVEYIDIQQKSDIAPLRILSFDIECGAKQGFPQANRDPIIQIAAIVKIHNQPNDLVKYILSLRECSPIPGAIVKNFHEKKTDDENEKDLILEFQRFVQLIDPDFFTGYNITNFDFPYILNRASHLKVGGGKDKYGWLGRIIQKRTKLKDGKYLSKAMGMRDTKEMNFEGRVQLDMYIHMQMSHKLSSYSLNTVASIFLKNQKEDVHHSIIYTLWEQNPETRKRLALYCLKDSDLPLRLMEKLMCLYNYCEMARVTGVPIIYLFIRGQQIKVASQMYRKAKQVNMIIPCERSNKSEGKFEGAFVLDPVRNFYEVPVATLDFASLYPSIMRAHNLCYSTLITNPQVRDQLKPDQYTRTPHGDYFVKDGIRTGLLPEILKELLTARKNAKKELAAEKDPFKKAVLDGRQLALKVSANSVYGFTGAQVGQLPCLAISSSVTSFGREMIMQTKRIVLETYNKQNGYEHDSEVVYGDTDSVMVKFGVKTVEEAMKLGKEAADLISKTFLTPIKLEFEKVYFPYLLMNKKRYAGVYWTRPEKYDKIDTKGIENVRRDNCQLIRTLIDKVLKQILVDRDKQGAINLIKQTVSDLVQNKVDMSMLVITKSLSKQTYEENEDDDEATATKKKDAGYKVKMAHVELAEKMKKRDPGSAPQMGDRVPYVIIAGAKGSKNYENAEDPIEILQKDLPIDFDYYIEKQIKPPLMRIFESVIPNPQTLFHGEHTKKRYVPKSGNTALGKFIKVKQTCLACRGPVKDNEAVCVKCEPKAIDIFTQKLMENNIKQREFAETWSQCQRCQGSLHDEIICSNKDCPIFYKRTKLRKDLEQNQQTLERFQSEW